MVMTEARSELSYQPARKKPNALRDYANRCRAELIEDLDVPGRGGRAFARKHAALADELIRGVFEQARAGCRELPLLLGAVGGYGRGLLALGSDLDLCFVTLEHNDAISDCVQAMLYPLWDAGIQVGHQIVQLSEVASDATGDLAMATELLDFRPLAGDLSLFPSLQQQLGHYFF